MKLDLCQSCDKHLISVAAVQSLLKEARIKPQINQIEGHIYFRSMPPATCKPVIQVACAVPQSSCRKMYYLTSLSRAWQLG